MGPKRQKNPFAKSLFMRLSSLLLGVIACLWLVAPSVSAAEYITGSGCSVSNIGYLTDLATEYERRAGIKVFVRGGGSVVGIEDLRSGKVDFAAACRQRSAGDPEDVIFVQVAWDALVFIVHPSNPIDAISLNNVRSVYAGRVTDWRQLRGNKAPIKGFLSRA